MAKGYPVVLLVTETSDLAADLLVLAARERGIPLIRFNQDLFPQHAQIVWRHDAPAIFRCEDQSFTANDVSGAWFRRPPRQNATSQVDSFVARESHAFLSGVWETAPWFWLNPPAATARAEHKLLQLQHAQRIGLAVPETLAANSPQAARRFVRRGPAIAKTLAGGRTTIDGIDHVVFTTAVAEPDLASDASLQACPIIFQNRIDTCFDLRVIVIGDRVFPARIMLRDRTAADLDWRRIPPDRLRYQHHSLPPDLQRQCIDLVASLGLIYGALDFIVTPGHRHIFLELNPAGQWGWIERALGLPITSAILDRLRETPPCA